MATRISGSKRWSSLIPYFYDSFRLILETEKLKSQMFFHCPFALLLLMEFSNSILDVNQFALAVQKTECEVS